MMYKSQIDSSKTEYAEIDPTGRYGRFKELLGKGAMKTVYRAFDEVLGMEVAWNQVKLNDVFRSPDELQRLYSEVHLLRTLNHDSIIKFYTSWIDVNRRTFNFITEMFTSGTLREYRQKYKRVDIRAVKNWARQILRGLSYLHDHDPPVIHRDIKCDNIFVNGHLGLVKIGDLGLAAILRGPQAHSVIGTPEFMAPELYEEEYNELVDIYSFGMCVLEMLTSEYPYGECSNPAQIYKKVTSGKLPEAFHRIHDLEGRKFVGKCLETASKRMSAKELLLDPFLASDVVEMLPFVVPTMESHQAISNDNGLERLASMMKVDQTRSTDMTITGKMNPEDDTIFLKVQIADKDGRVRNIYFPFDVVSDTPIDVATEMVKELEISDREPMEIAEMIDREISALVPQWKEWDPSQNHPYHSYSYQDDEDEDEDGRPHHPFYSFSSCSSSHASLTGLLSSHGTHFSHGECINYGYDWLQDDDDTSSQSSLYSHKYSNMNYISCNEHDFELSPKRREHNQILKNHKCTRFCPEEDRRAVHPIGYNDTRIMENRRLTRNRSLVDVRSQLLQRSLVEEVYKKRLFKTVGAVENIGYRVPCDFSGKKAVALPPSMGAGCSVRASKRDGKTTGSPV